METGNVEAALNRIAKALEERNKFYGTLQKRLATPAEAVSRVFGQPADPTDEKPEIELVRGQADIVRLAVAKAWNGYSQKVSGPDDDSPTDWQVFTEEVTDAIKSCIDFRNDSEAKLAQAMGELHNLRRDTNKIKLDSLKGVRALCLLHFVQSKLPPQENIKAFVSAIDGLIEMNTARREVL